MEGVLEVQTDTHWKQLYCKITDNSRLCFFIDDSCTEMDSSLDLRQLKGVVQGPADQRMIQLHAGDETSKLRAKSEEVASQWVKGFKQIAKRVRVSATPKSKYPNAVYQGNLWKRAIKSGRNWKKRWFVLTENTLSYYAHEGATKAKVGI